MADAILAPSRPHTSRPRDVQSIPVSLIDPPSQNPRRELDEEDLKRLAASIARKEMGILQPVVVRPAGERFELVIDERRFRAIQRLGWETIDATVRELNERQATEARLVENVHRKDLNPIEEGVAFRILRRLGHSSYSIAALLQVQKRVINTRLALLTLPDEWQERVRSGQISVNQAAYLVPWAKRPQILDAIARLVEKNADVPLTEWRHRVTIAVLAVSRSMDPAAPDGPRFNLTQAKVRRLDVERFFMYPGKLVRRAFATGLWDEWQDQAVNEGLEIEDTESPRPIPSSYRANGAASTRAPEDDPTVVYGSPVLLEEAAAEAEFKRRLAAWKASYLRQICCDRIADAEPWELPGLTKSLGVDLQEAWNLRRDFLELFPDGRLESLAEELGVNVGVCRDDHERIAVLLAAAPKIVPIAFHEATEPAPVTNRESTPGV